MNTKTPLARKISPLQLFFYGLGTIIGAGFYALLGKIAGESGYFAPSAFFLSAFIALFTALSYCELSGRYPYSGGEAHYVDAAYQKNWLTSLVGWMVILTGLVSAATLTSAISGFVADLVHIPASINLVLCVAFLGGIAIWGIGKSTFFVVTVTCLEVGLLLAILWYSSDNLGVAFSNIENYIPSFEMSSLTAVMGGAILAFYAFIGFEDMVNLSEEVKDVQKAMPRAILASLFVATALYVLISMVALTIVTPEELNAANTPIAVIMHNFGSVSPTFIGIVSILAASNGALVQIVMASRVAYGMASTGTISPFFKEVHEETQTPIKATLFMMGLILLLAFFFPLTDLAKVTSSILLGVFFFINMALLKMKANPDKFKLKKGITSYPRWIPLTGAASSGFLLLYTIATKLL